LVASTRKTVLPTLKRCRRGLAAFLGAALAPSLAHASISIPGARLDDRPALELPSALAALEQRAERPPCVAFCGTVELSLKSDGIFGGGGSVVSQDAWGNHRFPAELDSSKNRFGFTGYELDKETGLYNAKARYFDPNFGRFLTQDSHLGKIDDPPSLHRYFYGHANPLRYVDPTGHASEELQQWRADIDRRYRAAKSDEERRRIFAEALGAPLVPAKQLGDRGMGVARVVGGAGQVVVGAGAASAPEPVLTKVVGVVAIERGLENMWAGLRQAWTGEVEETPTGNFIRTRLENAGVDRTKAQWTSMGVEVLLDVGSTALASRGAAAAKARRPEAEGVPESMYPAPLEERLAAYKAWRAAGGDKKDFGRFVGAHRPGARGTTLYPEASDFRTWPEGHGNAASSGKTAYLYRLWETDAAGEPARFLKWGVTGDPATRYSADYMRGKVLTIEATGARATILKMERAMTEVDPGPLSKEPWAGSRLQVLER
jgi:RHS repeat-associated protein